MKRLLGITSGLFFFFAGAASAWSDCKRITFDRTKQNRPTASSHAHHHHSDADHAHSHDALIHCPALDEFITVANSSTDKDRRVERVPAARVNELDLWLTRDGSRLNDGPPGFEQSSLVPAYLLLSVLRI